MPYKILQKSLQLLLKRQTNILSAALIIMMTVLLSQFLGLVRQRMLVGAFGASNTLGIYLASTKLPDVLFQIIIAGALSSAFIPIFSDFLAKGEDAKAHKMASTLLFLGLLLFLGFSLLVFLFAPFILQVSLNLGNSYTPAQVALMANLMRIVLFSQVLFIVGTFFSALLQSYNHFFIPGIAAACYNLGIILGILLFSGIVGIYAPALGMILGALFFILLQVPSVRRVGFSFSPSLSLAVPGVQRVIALMGPRTLSLAIFQVGSIAIFSLISFLSDPGRKSVIFDYAQTLAFAPVSLFGQTIAQAAFPVLSRQREKLAAFKVTFTTSFHQMLYLVLPVSVLILVLRIPIVRLIYGASQFDWGATVLTGRTLAFFSLSIFAQALIGLTARAFYALHNTKTPLIVGTISTVFMLAISYSLIMHFHDTVICLGSNRCFAFGVEGLAFSYSIASILQLFVLLFYLGKSVGGFERRAFLMPVIKITIACVCTGFALYIPIKLLDQLVFDTTHTVNLIILTGISSILGLILYIFLTWVFNVEEAKTFLLMFRRIGNWREILEKSDEVLDGTSIKA